MSIAQTVNGHNAHPMGLTQTQPTLAEAPCSLNCFVDVPTLGRVQLTGRGTHATEAIAHLAELVDGVRLQFAPPVAVIVETRSVTERLGAILAYGLAKAVKCGNVKRVEQLSKAAGLVLSGAVEACAIDGYYTVKSRTNAEVVYDVSMSGTCSCEDYRKHASAETEYWCLHGLAVLFMVRLADTAAA